MTIIIDSNSQQIAEQLNRLVRSANNLQPALKEIGEQLVSSTKARFDTQPWTAPDGTPWADNSAYTIAQKGRNYPLTGLTSQLKKQIHWQLVGGDAVDIGSTMDYAAKQQFGETKAQNPSLLGDVPARPFLGLSDQDEIDVLEIIAAHLENSL